MGKQWKQCQTLFLGAPKSLQMVIAAMKLNWIELNWTELIMTSLDKYLFRTYAHFSVGLFVFILSYVNCLHILEINPMFVTSFVNISNLWSSFISFLGCITDYLRCSSLKQNPFIFSKFIWIRSPHTTQLCPLLTVSQGWRQGVGWAVLLFSLFPNSHHCWQISFHCGCTNKVFISLRVCSLTL